MLTWSKIVLLSKIKRTLKVFLKGRIFFKKRRHTAFKFTILYHLKVRLQRLIIKKSLYHQRLKINIFDCFICDVLRYYSIAAIYYQPLELSALNSIIYSIRRCNFKGQLTDICIIKRRSIINVCYNSTTPVLRIQDFQSIISILFTL